MAIRASTRKVYQLSRVRWASSILAFMLIGVFGMSTLAVGVASAAPTCDAYVMPDNEPDGSRQVYSACSSDRAERRIEHRVVAQCNGERVKQYGSWMPQNKSSKIFCRMGVIRKDSQMREAASGMPGRPQ